MTRIAGGEWKDLARDVDGAVVFFNKITAAMTPRLDLAEMAQGDDPAALMAQRLLILERDDDRSRALLEQAHAALDGVARDERWSVVNEHRNAADPPLSDTALRELLQRSGMMALNAMVSQNEPGDSE